MKANSILKIATEVVLKSKMEEETKLQVYDLGGEQLLKPQEQIREIFEKIRTKQYQRAIEYVEEMPEFKIAKLSQEGIFQLGEEELAKHTLKAEKSLTSAFGTGLKSQQTVNAGFGLSFAVNNQHAKDYASHRAGAMISGVNETTRKEINGILTKAINNQMSKDELLERLQTSFAFSKYRANMIANNEIWTAFIQGTIKQHQELMVKTWIEGRKKRESHKDEKTSDICRENDAQDWIPFNQEFWSGHFAPLGHVNCRCVLRVRPFKPWEVPDLLGDMGKETPPLQEGLVEQVDESWKNTKLPDSLGFEFTQEYLDVAGKYKDQESPIGTINEAIIRYYSDKGYKDLNKNLRAGVELSEKDAFVLEVLDKILDNNQEYTEVTYRGIMLDKEELKAIIASGKYQDKGFMSTTKEFDIARGFLRGNKEKVVLKIKHKWGMEIEKYSLYDGQKELYNEKEVLLWRNRSFKITWIQQKSWFTQLTLQEYE